MLHRMVHTKLLSGSLSEDISLKPAARRKAMEGRLLELTGSSKLGKGENIIRKGERNKASTRVRKGLQDKVQERRKEKLEEVRFSPFYTESTSSCHKIRPRIWATTIGHLNGCTKTRTQTGRRRRGTAGCRWVLGGSVVACSSSAGTTSQKLLAPVEEAEVVVPEVEVRAHEAGGRVEEEASGENDSVCQACNISSACILGTLPKCKQLATSQFYLLQLSDLSKRRCCAPNSVCRFCDRLHIQTGSRAREHRKSSRKSCESEF